MSVLQDMQKRAPKAESEQPADCLPVGEQPCEIISAQFAVKDWKDNETGEERQFATGRMGLKVLTGPEKDGTTFINIGGKGSFPLTIPEAGAPITENTRKMVTYFVQHATDAIGFAKKFDPNWKRVETVDEKGKKKVSFAGACIDGAMLLEIAQNDAAAKELAAMLVGCRGLFTFGTQAGKDSTREFQTFKSVRELNDATLADWKAKVGGGGGEAPKAGGSGIYS